MIYNALKFGAATSDRAGIGSGASISNLSKQTIIAWVYPTTLTNARAIYGSRRGTNPSVDTVSIFRFFLTGTTGNINLTVVNTVGTSRSNYSTTDTPLAALNTWIFIVATYDDGPSVTTFFRGTLTTPPTLCAITGSGGTGTLGVEGAGEATWGNRDNFLGTGFWDRAFQGDIALGQLYNRVLTLEEITRIWADPKPLGGCVNYTLLAEHGNSFVRDRSGYGNHGLIVGAVPSFNPISQLYQDQAPIAHWERALFIPASGRASRLPLLGVA